MAMGMGMRTIWISLRAMNYTDRAFTAAIINMKKLTAKEREELKIAQASLTVSRMRIQSGMLYAAITGMIVGQMWNLMQAAEMNSEYMAEFTQTITELKSAFADTFIDTLKPVLDVMKRFLELLRDNKPLQLVILYLGLGAVALIGMNAAYNLLSGAVTHYLAMAALNALATKLDIKLKGQSFWASMSLVGAKLKLALANHVLAISLFKVALAAGAGFAIFFALKDVIGPIPAALLAIAGAAAILAISLWSAAIPMSILSWGLAAIAAGAAIAGILAMTAGITGFEGGTRALPHTGLFFGHKGEMVFNPSTGRPTGISEEAGRAIGGGGAGGPSITHQDIDINVEHLHTEAKFDDLDEKMSKKFREKMRNNR